MPPMGGNPDTVSFSGFGSGGYMSQQMLFVYPSKIMGIATQGAGPYGNDFNKPDSY